MEHRKPEANPPIAKYDEGDWNESPISQEEWMELLALADKHEMFLKLGEKGRRAMHKRFGRHHEEVDRRFLDQDPLLMKCIDQYNELGLAKYIAQGL